MTEQEIVEKLMDSNDEFRSLKEQHAQLEARLEDLYSSKKVFNSEEELEIKSIKRQKLQLKDRMNVLIGKVKKGELAV